MPGQALDDLLFGDIVASYLGAPRFLRRDWLARDLAQRLAEPAVRFVLLTAEPGAGKSAFIAQMAADHPDWPRFFIRRDEVTSMGEIDARSFLLRIGFQLAAIHPELFDLEQVRIEVAQRIGAVGQGADVVGAEIDRIYASPFHRVVVRIQQKISQAGGSVAAVRIGEWVADPRLMELEDLQQMALFDPARILQRLSPGERIVVLVDALDELRFRDQEKNLLDWLANCPPVPDNVRIVLTSRPSPGQLTVFMQKRKDFTATLAIDAADQRVQHDIGAYAETMIAPDAIAAALERRGRTRDEFLAELVAKADGNIGYLAAIGRAFDQAIGPEEHLGPLEDLLSLSDLPEGLRGLYAFFLRLIQTGPGSRDLKVTDPRTRKAGLVNAWEELFHPILGVLATCLAPLTLDQIQVFTGTFADRAQLVNAMEGLGQFLDRIGPTYRLYHATLAEFLVAGATRADAETSGFFVDATAEHRRLADVMAGDDGPEAVWQDVPDPLGQGRRDYARRHYIAHLYLGQDWDRLADVIDDSRYGRGKLRFDRSTVLYFGDLELAIRAITRPELDDDSRLAQLPRLWRYSMLLSSLTSKADTFPDAALTALCLLDRADEAEGLAQLLSSQEHQGLAYAAMGGALASRAADRDRARKLLLRSCALARELRDVEERTFVLDRILSTCRAVARSGFADPELAQQVFALASWHADNGGGAESLATAIWYFHQSGAQPGNVMQHLEAIDMFLLAPTRRNAEQPGQPLPVRIDMLIAVSRVERLLDRAGDTRYTLQTAVSVAESGEAGERIDGLVAVAREFIALDDRDRALSMLRDAKARYAAIRAEEGRRGYLPFGQRIPGREVDIGEALAQAGDWATALSIAAGLDIGWGVPAVAAVREMCRQSDWDLAIKTAADMAAREKALTIGGVSIMERYSHGDRHSKPDSAFLAIIDSLATAGQIERAAELAQGLATSARADGLALVAAECARQGKPSIAQVLLEQVSAVLQLDAAWGRRVRIWPPLMDLFAVGDAFSQGTEAAIRSGSDRGTRECLERIANALAERGRFGEALDIVGNLKGSRTGAARAVLRHAREGQPDWEAVSGRVLQLMMDDLAEGRSPESPDEADLVANPLIWIADLLIRRGEHERAAKILFDAVDALNRVQYLLSMPSPWHLIPAAFARANQRSPALQLMNQISSPFDRTCGLVEFAQVAHVQGRPDVARNMLADAFGTASNADELWRSDLQGRTAVMAVQLDLPDLVDSFLERIPPDSADGRGVIAMALAEKGESGRARDILTAIPRQELSPWVDLLSGANEVDPFSGPYAAVVKAMLKQGELNAAVALLPEVSGKADRVNVSIDLAVALVQAGRTSDAVNELTSSGELWESARTLWHLDSQLRDIAARLRETADARTSILQVEKRWKNATSWEQLAPSFCWAHAVVALRPGIAGEIAAGFDWVESALVADSATTDPAQNP